MSDDTAAQEPLDAYDARLLTGIREVYDAVDPVPEGLVERLQFALALDEMFAEVAMMTRLADDALAVRSDPVTGTRTETVTFSTDGLTAMVTLSRIDGRVRVDGWIAPPATVRVRLRMQSVTRETEADDSGRFVFDELPEGFAQLSFHPRDDGAGEESEGVIVTPLFQL